MKTKTPAKWPTMTELVAAASPPLPAEWLTPLGKVLQDIRYQRWHGHHITCFSTERLTQDLRGELARRGYRVVRHNPQLWLVEFPVKRNHRRHRRRRPQPPRLS